MEDLENEKMSKMSKCQTKVQDPSHHDQGVPRYNEIHHPFPTGSVTLEPWSMDLGTVVPLGIPKLGTCFMVVIC